MVELKGLKQTTLALLDEPVHPVKHTPSLGMSEIGHSCSRYLWYKFRWAYDSSFSDRMIRLFNRGHREEEHVINLLKRIGYTVDNPQKKVVAGFGHTKGFCDGEILGVIEAPKTWHILEIKLMGDKAYKEILKKGVKSARPVYHAQCQLYMHHFKRSRCLFVVVNKNDDSIYIERIRYDIDTAFALNKRAEGIILSDTPPSKAYSSTWYICKFCNARHICHEGIQWKEHCRTCTYAAPAPESKWVCNLLGYLKEEELSYEKQLIGCRDYKSI